MAGKQKSLACWECNTSTNNAVLDEPFKARFPLQFTCACIYRTKCTVTHKGLFHDPPQTREQTPYSLERGAGEEVASAFLGSNGEVQQLSEHEAQLAKGEAAAAVDPSPLAWLPQTLASVALRLQSLDANLFYADGHATRDVLTVS